MMLIRKATKKDLDEILYVEEKSFIHGTFSRRAISYHIENNLVLCASLLDRVTGYICFSPLTKKKKRRIYSVAVHPDHLRKGIGQSLMIAGESKSNAREIILEVDEKNKSAIALYKKLGYEQFDRYDHYYDVGVHALRLKKVLK